MARLAVLLPNMRGGGAERVALTLIEGFLERGHEIDLLVLQWKGELIDLLPKSVRVVDLKAGRMRNAILPVANYLRENSPEALLAVMWPMPVIAIIARVIAQANTRIVTSDHGILSQHYRGQNSKLVALWLTTKFFYPLADCRVAASASIASDLARHSGSRNLTIEVIPNPICMPPAQIEGRREAAGLWRGRGKRILAVGTLSIEKNHADLLRAFADLSKSLPVQLMILGEGPLRSELEKLAQMLQIADRVAMPGFRTNPWPFFVSADLLVLSSTTEGFGNVLIEAMAVGLPVVSTDCGGPRELLKDGAFGQLVRLNDVAALRAAMEGALFARINRERLKQRSKQYGPGRAVDAYLQALIGPN